MLIISHSCTTPPELLPTIPHNKNTYYNADEFGTHKVLQQGLHALDCMEHRGACGGDGISGDGAGIMTQIPWQLFAE